MKFKLSYKLFAAFFLILAVAVGALALSRYLFSLNFRSYIHQVELERLQSLVPDLRAKYRANGGWEGAPVETEQWRRVMWIGPGAPPPLPPEHSSASSGEADEKRFQSEGHRGPPDVLLTDDRGRPIVGSPKPGDEQQLVPVEVDGRIVGWLGLQRREPFRKGPPAVLLERQARHHYLLGAAVVALTALIAFLFSRHLLRPIQALERGTRELAGRNFKVRIAPATGDELGQLAENFNTMARTLENYEQIRRQWLTDISHELRTPLSVLRGEIEALQDGVREPSPANLASLLAEIMRVGKLVEDLHLLSLADSDRIFIDKQPVHLGRVLASVVENYQTRLAECRINTELRIHEIEEVRLRGDAGRLGQVFTNIIENACRYVNSPGTLKIIGRRDDRFLTLRFMDSGPGVPEDALPRLFDRLYRVERSRSRDSGGSGLGLAICRHIVENHDGEIWAEHSPMGGVTIGMRLPIEG
jgi:two-component system sensor histidine kinase BaeS